MKEKLKNFFKKIKNPFARKKFTAVYRGSAYRSSYKRPSLVGSESRPHRRRRSSNVVARIWYAVCDFFTGLFRKLVIFVRSADRRLVYGIGAALVVVIAVPVIIAVASPPASAVVGDDTGTVSAQNIEANANEEEPSAPKEVKPLESASPGMTDPYIMTIQERLMDLGYMENDEPSEEYDDATKNAITLLQRKYEMEMTGVASKEVLTLLFSAEVKPYSVSEGISGTDVEELQTRLWDLGYLDKATGYFGSETKAAVLKFQERNGLSVDGTIGEQTREALYSTEAKANAFTPGEESEDIKKFQNRLKDLGYLTTKPDGKYGSDTVAAVKRFQDRHGLIADGYIGQVTKKILMSGEAESNALALGMEGDDVKNMQKRLKALGYLSASATGYFGDQTDAAVKAFQKQNKLSVDGKVGKVTMNLLMSSKAKTSDGSSAGHIGNNSGVERLIKAASSKLGCRYVLGAKGPNRFDCSGLAYWCLNQAGVRTGYMTSYAWRTTNKFRRIKSMGDIRRGDIIIYKLGATRGHVGIALGGGMMIDASSSKGKVVKRSYQTSYWKNSFYCAYRVF